MTLRRANTRPRYDGPLMIEDAAERGWNVSAVARRSGLSKQTVSRFFLNQLQTPTSAQKIAEALGHPLSRYLIRRRSTRRAGAAA